ncbi:hypothetical protein HYDPIDRAFT_113894 [Hydnomerulius pinastri MD-312]|uniref:F-box domain-containing protein n=1 Tax=Hydnomerulius pinastri MD-312 TaxID=994086 RepID=A0A0C9VX40_9AGAM|nr:hypothetical protein HYDPIDRAFT_113894 [Hydnomerulius pinastri MD-312]
MELVLIQLPQDILILICLHLSIEDILSLKQTCRVMHALGSLDYLWHMLVADLDVPLDIPLNVSIAALSSTFLRNAVTKALKLDQRWRDPNLHYQSAKRIISSNSSFVDGLHLLPGGHWLVTIQYEQIASTHLTLWSLKDPRNIHSIFKVTVFGRVRFLQAQHQNDLQRITIGIAFARGAMEWVIYRSRGGGNTDIYRSINVYHVFLQDSTSSATSHAAVFETMSGELSSFGRIAGMKICGEIMVAVFAPLTSTEEGKIICLNLRSRAAVVIECTDWSFARGPLKLFPQYFAVITSRYTLEHASACISYYRVPSTVLGDTSHPPVARWPVAETLNALPISSTSWRHDRALVIELSDDPLATAGDACFFSMIGFPTAMQHVNVTDASIIIILITFDGTIIRCLPTVLPCHSLPSIGEVRASASGRRAVWLNSDPDGHECTLIKFVSGRSSRNLQLPPRISILMPSFSGLPFNPRDFHSFGFDEVSCKLAVSLPSGELYLLDY